MGKEGSVRNLPFGRAVMLIVRFWHLERANLPIGPGEAENGSFSTLDVPFPANRTTLVQPGGSARA